MALIQIAAILILQVWCSAQQTQNQTAVAGVSTNINIPCSLGREEEAPFWYINDTSYELFSIPQFFPYIPVVDSYTQLTIPEVYPELNDTLFRCAHIDNRGIVVFGVPQRLLVANPNGFPRGEIPGGIILLQINYQAFDIEQNAATLGWNNPGQNCGENFEFLLEGYPFSQQQMTLSSTTPISNHTTREFSAQIPSNQLRTANDSIVYRVVALDENGICSDSTSQESYYRFDESEGLRTRVIALNNESCYIIPVRGDICTTPIFVWPRRPNSGEDPPPLPCTCSIGSSSRAQVSFNNCNCFSQSNHGPTNVRFRFSASGNICIIDEGAKLNNTIVHFQCSRSCSNVISCFLKTILELHKIIVAGPPGTPNITYNASEGALCLSAYSHTEFPVLNFTVTVTDNTGIESPLSGTYVNTGKGPLCLNVTSDPVPNVCHPFQVSVTAWNAIGSSPSVNVDMFTQEDPNRSEAERLQDRCACYQEREQTTNISITRITDTAAVFTLMCGLNLADPLEYRLLSTHIQLMCGIGFRVTTLMPDVNYTLYRVYSDLRCKVDSFTTEDTMNDSSTTPESIEFVALVAVPIIIVLVLIGLLLACCYKGRKIGIQVGQQVGREVGERVGQQVGQQVRQQAGQQVRQQAGQQEVEQHEQQIEQLVEQQIADEQFAPPVQQQVAQRVTRLVTRVAQRVGENVAHEVAQRVGRRVAQEVAQAGEAEL